MKNLKLILSSVTAVLGLLAAIAPYSFAKVCTMPKMHCHAVTAPTEFVFGILILLISIVQIVTSLKNKA